MLCSIIIPLFMSYYIRSGATRAVVREVVRDDTNTHSGSEDYVVCVGGLTYDFHVATMLIKHVLLVR
jgi:hypothetical protein